MSQDEFLTELCAKNNPWGPIWVVEKLESYRPIVKTAPFVIEVDTHTRKQFLNRGKVLVQWNVCVVTTTCTLFNAQNAVGMVILPTTVGKQLPCADIVQSSHFLLTVIFQKTPNAKLLEQ